MSALEPVINQVGYPGVGDVDDCAVIATFWAARASGYSGSLPSVAAFRSAAGRPDRPGPTGITNGAVWRGVNGTSLRTLKAKIFEGPWLMFRSVVRAGMIASVAIDSSRIPTSLQYGFRGMHRVGVSWEDGQWYLANPLAPSGSRPRTIAEDRVHAASTSAGGGAVLAVVFPPQEASAMKYNPQGGAEIGVATMTRDTQLIRWDGSRAEIAKGAKRSVWAIVTIADGRKAYLCTWHDAAAYLIADDRATYAAQGSDRKHRLYVSVDGTSVFDKEV